MKREFFLPAVAIALAAVGASAFLFLPSVVLPSVERDASAEDGDSPGRELALVRPSEQIVLAETLPSTHRQEVADQEEPAAAEHRRRWSSRVGTTGRAVGTLELPVLGELYWDEFVLEGSQGRPEHVGKRRAARFLRELRGSEGGGSHWPVEFEDLPPGRYDLVAEATVRPDDEWDAVHLVRWAQSFEVFEGATTDLGILRDSHPVLDVCMVLRDLRGERVSIDDEFQRPVWSLLILGEDSDSDFEFDSGGADRLTRFVSDRRCNFSISWPHGWSTTLLAQAGRYDYGGWRLVESDHFFDAEELIAKGGECSWTAYRTEPLELNLSVEARDWPPTYAHLSFVHIESGTSIFRSGSLELVDEGASAVVHRMLLDDAPVGRFRVVGRAGWIGHDDAGMWMPAHVPGPVAIGVLVDGVIDVVLGGENVQLLTATRGATIEGRVVAVESRMIDSIELRPVDPALHAARATSSGGASDDGRSFRYRETGLLPNTRYAIAEGGRVVTTGADGSTLVVELDGSDFPAAER